jgi:hypothetical protein
MMPGVTLWARLTWQTSEPDALARDLAARLGVPAVRGGLVAGATILRLGNADLEIRPWIREGPDDAPRLAGRLLLEPVPDGEAAPEPAAGDPMLLVGLGWATVDLDRAADELGPWLGPPADAPSGVDHHLGAGAVLRAGGGLPGAWTVLLEPSTEGRAAASLARDSEGPCALYLRPAAGLDAWLASAGGRPDVRDGPFGRQVLLPGEATGPFLVVTEGREPRVATGPTGTIDA